MKESSKLKLNVATPCPASWDDMEGDERVRFCSECELSVYNLSAMSEDEAIALAKERGRRLCARFYQREDGTVLTEDCPVGVEFVSGMAVVGNLEPPPTWVEDE